MTEPNWCPEWRLASRPRPSLHNASAVIAQRAGQGSDAAERRQETLSVERSRMNLTVVGVSEALCSPCLDADRLTHLWKVAAGLMRALVCPLCDGQADVA